MPARHVRAACVVAPSEQLITRQCGWFVRSFERCHARSRVACWTSSRVQLTDSRAARRTFLLRCGALTSTSACAFCAIVPHVVQPTARTHGGLLLLRVWNGASEQLTARHVAVVTADSGDHARRKRTRHAAMEGVRRLPRATTMRAQVRPQATSPKRRRTSRLTTVYASLFARCEVTRRRRTAAPGSRRWA